MILFLEQMLNALQFGVFLFLLASGLTLIFGIMGIINLAHGSLFMLGAFGAATFYGLTGNFFIALCGSVLVTAAIGVLVEWSLIRRLYQRDHLDQVLATFALILIANELVTIGFGRTPLFMDIPASFTGSWVMFGLFPFPIYRLIVILVGGVVALALYLLMARSRLGMMIRAGAHDRAMVAALGVNIQLLYTVVFALGALLAGLAGVMAAPLLSVEAGMGENILILTFVVIIIGGIGSVRGALAGALLVGLFDTLGRIYLPMTLKLFLAPAVADGIAAGLSSMMIYLLMAITLIWRPRGLFPAQTGGRA